MLLSNFRLIRDSCFATDIDAFGHRWELHNLTDFLGFTYSVQSQTVTLSWRYFPPNDPPDAKYSSDRFDLPFHQAYYFEVTTRDPAMPADEDRTLDTVSFIAASDATSEYVVNDLAGRPNGLIPCFDPDVMEGEYHFFFRFRGGQTIRIGAETAEFVLVPKETDT